jgi:ferredoxin
MITAERKPLEELMEYIKPFKRILLVGCNECVTVCAAGGRKEVGLLASGLHMAVLKSGATIEIREHTLERQCDPEYVEELVPMIDGVEAVMSMACGCGVQEIARRFKNKPVFPALNTKFMGASERQGVWSERCQGCGDCLLGMTGGICPIARCAKQLMNGPCGGSTGGHCEIGEDTDCAWALIWERLKALGQIERYVEITPAKDWRPGGGSGPRKIIREDLAE